MYAAEKRLKKIGAAIMEDVDVGKKIKLILPNCFFLFFKYKHFFNKFNRRQFIFLVLRIIFWNMTFNSYRSTEETSYGTVTPSPCNQGLRLYYVCVYEYI